MIVIHAGMHKTGSSSIQESLARLDGDRLIYVPWASSNHSGLFPIMFSDAPEKRLGYAQSGATDNDIRVLKKDWLHKVDGAFEQYKNSDRSRPLVFSAEVISTEPESDVQRLAAYARKYSNDVRVIAYVRPPASFMSSAFQQRQKTGTFNRRDYNLGCWPYYEARFSRLDRIFGRENVTLKVFDRKKLFKENVVLDFANEIGVSISEDEVATTNESLSLEAVALLYTQTYFRTSDLKKERKEFQAQRKFIRDVMPEIGSNRFVLGKEVTQPMIDANRADLDWMEARLGISIEDTPKENEHTINSHDDLLKVAAQSSPLVDQAIEQMITTDDPAVSAARRVDLLKEAMRMMTEKQPNKSKGKPKAKTKRKKTA